MTITEATILLKSAAAAALAAMVPNDDDDFSIEADVETDEGDEENTIVSEVTFTFRTGTWWGDDHGVDFWKPAFDVLDAALPGWEMVDSGMEGEAQDKYGARFYSEWVTHRPVTH